MFALTYQRKHSTRESGKESDDPDITMYGTTSLLSFSELVGNVPIDAVVKVQYKYPGKRETLQRKASHVVVVWAGRISVVHVPDEADEVRVALIAVMYLPR